MPREMTAIAAPALLEVAGLTKRYADEVALADIAFSVQSGEVLGLIGPKLAAVVAAWVLSSLPVFSALVLWSALGGHLYAPETLNLLFGHLLYGMLVGTIALFAAAISDNAATAAIITLAFTIASWVLDFTAAGHPGILEWLSRLSLTQMLRTFEQGLLLARVVLAVAIGVCAFTALAAI